MARSAGARAHCEAAHRQACRPVASLLGKRHAASPVLVNSTVRRFSTVRAIYVVPSYLRREMASNGNAPGEEGAQRRVG